MVTSVSSSELQILRNLRVASGYTCVYPHHRGKLWRACVYSHTVRLGLHPNPREAAAAVVTWWRERFGPDWPAVYECHQSRPWVITKQRGEGYRLFVWEFGRRRCLPPDDPRLDWFWTVGDAKAHLERWRQERYGCFDSTYWLFLRRHGGDEFAPLFRHRSKPQKLPLALPAVPSFLKNARCRSETPSPTPPFPRLA